MSNGDASSSIGDPTSPHPREYTIYRNEKLGYGFIAGSEKPVIVRSVTAGKIKVLVLFFEKLNRKSRKIGTVMDMSVDRV